MDMHSIGGIDQAVGFSEKTMRPLLHMPAIDSSGSCREGTTRVRTVLLPLIGKNARPLWVAFTIE